jgi:phosphatidylglycerol:prolipoprotein diacylglycerol transferase
MIPVVARVPEWIPLLGDQAVTSFGVALLAAFLVGGALFVRRLRRSEPGAGWDLVVTTVAAGVIGAKVLHVLIASAFGLPTGGMGRGGLNWFGGLAVGAVVLFWQARRQGMDPARVAGAAAPPLALGFAIGRVGSFLAGTDYGVPTGLPWGLTFPRGAPPTTPLNVRELLGAAIPPAALVGDFVRVHPTQLYEAALSLGVFALLMRQGSRPGAPGNDSRMGGWRVFGLFLTLSGAARVLVEFVRLKQDVLVGPVTVDMLLAAAALGIGLVLWRRPLRTETREHT